MDHRWLARGIVLGWTAWALYAPIELTRIIVLYARVWPEAVPPLPFAVELGLIWGAWVLWAAAVIDGFRRGRPWR